MTGNRIAIDANVAVNVLNGVEPTASIIRAFPMVSLPVAVLAELHFGAINSSRQSKNLSRLDELLASCKVVAIDGPTAEAYARIRLSLKQRGCMIPMNDIWIAATCVRRRLTLATFDEHFERVDGLTVHRPDWPRGLARRRQIAKRNLKT